MSLPFSRRHLKMNQANLIRTNPPERRKCVFPSTAEGLFAYPRNEPVMHPFVPSDAEILHALIVALHGRQPAIMWSRLMSGVLFTQDSFSVLPSMVPEIHPWPSSSVSQILHLVQDMLAYRLLQALDQTDPGTQSVAEVVLESNESDGA